MSPYTPEYKNFQKVFLQDKEWQQTFVTSGEIHTYREDLKYKDNLRYDDNLKYEKYLRYDENFEYKFEDYLHHK